MIFLPLLIQVALTFVVYIALGVAKSRAIKNGEFQNRVWPKSVVKINDNIRNQLEVPVLFYVVTIVLWLLNSAGTVALVLAWLFVASRIVHAYVHTGSNYIPTRRSAFFFGCLVVMVMLGMAFRAVFASLH